MATQNRPNHQKKHLAYGQRIRLHGRRSSAPPESRRRGDCSRPPPPPLSFTHSRWLVRTRLSSLHTLSLPSPLPRPPPRPPQDSRLIVQLPIQSNPIAGSCARRGASVQTPKSKNEHNSNTNPTLIKANAPRPQSLDRGSELRTLAGQQRMESNNRISNNNDRRTESMTLLCYRNEDEDEDEAERSSSVRPPTLLANAFIACCCC